MPATRDRARSPSAGIPPRLRSLSLLFAGVAVCSAPAIAAQLQDAASGTLEPLTHPSPCRHPRMLDLTAAHPARTIREVVSRETGDVCYGVAARKGQYLDVRITHVDSNPVGLAVFRPGYTFTRIADGEVVDGSHLSGLGNTDGGTSAKTVIDQDGTWLLDFGLANGGAAAFTFRAILK